jgi:transcription antitermination factor NusG
MASQPDDLEERIAAYIAGGWGRYARQEREGECEWYAIRTLAQREHVSAAGLAERGFTTFIPMAAEWRGRPRQRVNEPVLPGYVFVLCNPQDFAELHGVDGNLGFVRYQREDGAAWPRAFPLEMILELQIAERSGLFDSTRTIRHRYVPRKGERVKITAGPYYGFVAKVLATPRGERCKLLIEGFEIPRRRTEDIVHLSGLT